jgi:lipopolysaccharide transport system ATP-binding protein
LIAMGAEKIIEFDHVGVGYKVKEGPFSKEMYWALKDVSFDLRRGEVLGVIGRNGAGKSTLLKLLADIIEPDRGAIRKQPNLDVMLLSIQVGVMPHLSGRENAIVSGMLLGMRRREVERAMDDIIEYAGLQEHIDRPVYMYSTGMKARLGFAVAQQVQPEVLLIDEVLGVGDEEFRKKTLNTILKRINSKQTLVLVSHNPVAIEAYCSRVLWIEDGRTKKVGNTKEILAEYMQS